MAARLLPALFAAHPVNRGKLPKGLSEHYIIDTDNRAKYPLLRRAASWFASAGMRR